MGKNAQLRRAKKEARFTADMGEMGRMCVRPLRRLGDRQLARKLKIHMQTRGQ